MRLLLLEDDETLGSGLHDFLKAEGHAVDWFVRLTAAKRVVDEPYDALLVDWQLPDGSGIEWIKSLRERGVVTPVLVMTARDLLSDRIKGLDSGADDYLVKPFEPEELVARIRAVRRRMTAHISPRIRIGQGAGSIEVDTNERFVLRDGVKVELTAREWSLLEALISRSGRVVSKPDIEALLTGYDGDTSSNAIEVHIFNLRRKLGREIIQTNRGLGYRIAS